MSPDALSLSSTPVAIVGAGPVGLSLALGLARHGCALCFSSGRATRAKVPRGPRSPRWRRGARAQPGLRTGDERWDPRCAQLAWKLAYAPGGGETERLLDSYEMERRAVVVESTSRYTDRITRIFIETPPVVRESAWAALRTMMRISRIRRMMLRRTAMIDLASPLLKRRERAAGVRLPNPLLRSPDGWTIRLYDLVPNAPVILAVAEEREADEVSRWSR